MKSHYKKENFPKTIEDYANNIKQAYGKILEEQIPLAVLRGALFVYEELYINYISKLENATDDEKQTIVNSLVEKLTLEGEKIKERKGVENAE